MELVPLRATLKALQAERESAIKRINEVIDDESVPEDARLKLTAALLDFYTPDAEMFTLLVDSIGGSPVNMN